VRKGDERRGWARRGKARKEWRKREDIVIIKAYTHV
jgi:hypothetical protein